MAVDVERSADASLADVLFIKKVLLTCLERRYGIAQSHLGQDCGAWLATALKRCPVYREQSIPIGIAKRPFVVVEQRPIEVTHDRYAFNHGRVQSVEGGGEVRGAQPVIIGIQAILGHEHRFACYLVYKT